MSSDGIRLGQIYRNVKRPRRAWRVTAEHGSRYRLERVDSPHVIRFPEAAVLRDERRYVREGDAISPADNGQEYQDGVPNRPSKGPLR